MLTVWSIVVASFGRSTEVFSYGGSGREDPSIRSFWMQESRVSAVCIVIPRNNALSCHACHHGPSRSPYPMPVHPIPSVVSHAHHARSKPGKRWYQYVLQRKYPPPSLTDRGYSASTSSDLSPQSPSPHSTVSKPQSSSYTPQISLGTSDSSPKTASPAGPGPPPRRPSSRRPTWSWRTGCGA